MIFFMSKKANSEYWQQVVLDQSSSGLTQLEWCEQNNVNIHNFRYWKRRLESELNSNHAVNQTETKWAIITHSEADIAAQTIKSLLCIHVGKAVVDVSPGFDPESLSTVLSVLMKHV